MKNRKELKSFILLNCYNKNGSFNVSRLRHYKEDLIAAVPNCESKKRGELAYWIINDLYDYPICPECRDKIKRTGGPTYYRQFCSNKCRYKSKKILDKQKLTCIKNMV